MLQPLDSQLRKKFEQLMTELIHERDVTRGLARQVASPHEYQRLREMRYVAACST